MWRVRARDPDCAESSPGKRALVARTCLGKADPTRTNCLPGTPRFPYQVLVVAGLRGFRIVAAAAVSECLWTNADDCLPVESLGRVEGGDGIVEGRDVADVGPQSSVPHPLDDLTQLGTVGLDDEVDCQAVVGPRLGRSYDGHQGSSGPDQACGPLLDVSADDVEHQVDAADVFQGVVVEVDELLRAEVERLLAVGGAPGADDVGAGLTCELRHHRPDCSG